MVMVAEEVADGSGKFELSASSVWRGGGVLDQGVKSDEVE